LPKRNFIDGYNVIRCNVPLAALEERAGNAAARDELIRLVRKYIERAGDAEWTIVFDGRGDGPGDKTRSGPLLCVFSESRTADEIIVESAADAAALGHEVVIVSNDAGVRCEGAAPMRSEDFYDELIRRPQIIPAREDESTAGALIAHLVGAGHLPRGCAADDALRADLAAQLEYFSHGNVPPNKLANKIEPFLRTHAPVTPTPDTQKIFSRAVKAFFIKKT
jgi:predicted RNA-binding protein with PIN domain